MNYSRYLATVCFLISITSALFGAKVYRGDGFEIRYPKGEKAFVEKIVAEVDLPFEMKSAKLFFEIAKTHRESDLDTIAGYLALEKPSEKMREVFDRFVALRRKLSVTLSEFVIYDGDELKEKLRKGKSIPGFTYDSETDRAEGAFGVFASNDDTTSEKIPPFPIVLTDDVKESLETRMDAFRYFVGILDSFSGNDEQHIFYFLVLHETIESEIVFKMIASDDRRWFADGMANAISLLTLKKRESEKSLRELLEKYYAPPENLLEILDTIDLVSWEAAENESREYPSEAYYYLATLAVVEMIEDLGDEFLADLFAELRTRDPKANDMTVIYEIFRNQTGKEMLDYIEIAKKGLRSAEAKSLSSAVN